MNLTNALLVTTPYLNATPLPHYPPMVQDPPAYREFVPGPGLFLTNGWITIHPERRTGLPGTPREGEVLTTEEAVLRPCFAAVDPACPGHLHTNLTRWRWTSGAWSRVPETNATIFWAGTTLPFTNFVSTNVVDFQSSATNVTIRLPEVEATHQKLSEILQKVREALKP